MAARAPGRHVEHWTDRPTVAPEFMRVWNSFCSLAAWVGNGDAVPLAVDSWVERHFWDETPTGKSVLVSVFLELMALRRELAKRPEPEEAE